MDETLWGLMNIIGPLILLGLLIWVIMKARARRESKPDSPPTVATDTTPGTERATHNLYDEEERRRRDGTDDL